MNALVLENGWNPYCGRTGASSAHASWHGTTWKPWRLARLVWHERRVVWWQWGAMCQDDNGTDLFARNAVGCATRSSWVAASFSHKDPFINKEEYRMVYDVPAFEMNKHQWVYLTLYCHRSCR